MLSTCTSITNTVYKKYFSWILKAAINIFQYLHLHAWEKTLFEHLEVYSKYDKSMESIVCYNM